MSLFDRTAFIEKVQTAFANVEKLLGSGDAFDYEEVALFSGIVNGYEEHVVFLPLTQSSVSYHLQRTLGDTKSWADISSLPLYGFYVLSPTNCINYLRMDTAYLVRAISWDRAEVVNSEGEVARMFASWARRGEPAKAYFTFRGNAEFHSDTCWTTTTNQVG
ncbi:hypothetical protein KKG90_05980 [Candidatus Bipolaricaulota bacterium]|nr:hypothetical protein [Candidatus Bipolaricaulota bacterium]